MFISHTHYEATSIKGRLVDSIGRSCKRPRIVWLFLQCSIQNHQMFDISPKNRLFGVRARNRLQRPAHSLTFAKWECFSKGGLHFGLFCKDKWNIQHWRRRKTVQVETLEGASGMSRNHSNVIRCSRQHTTHTLDLAIHHLIKGHSTEQSYRKVE